MFKLEVRFNISHTEINKRRSVTIYSRFIYFMRLLHTLRCRFIHIWRFIFSLILKCNYNFGRGNMCPVFILHNSGVCGDIPWLNCTPLPWPKIIKVVDAKIFSLKYTSHCIGRDEVNNRGNNWWLKIHSGNPCHAYVISWV